MTEKPRGTKIVVRVTAEEREALKEVSEWLGLSMSEFIRMCTFGEAAYHRKKMGRKAA